MRWTRIFTLFLLVLCCSIVLPSSPSVHQEGMLRDADADRICDNLEALIERAKPGEQLPVLITYKYNRRLTRAAAIGIRDYDNLPIGAGSMSAAAIRELARDPAVYRIELDGIVRPMMASAKNYFGITRIWNDFGYKGKGVVVAILDTGIQATHPDLAGQVQYWKDMVGGRPQPYDDEGHGTAVAGIIAGTGKIAPALAGVAPEAKLVVIKVVGHSGSAWESVLLKSLDLLLQIRQSQRIRVVNISLGVGVLSDGNDAFSIACDRLVSSGVFVVASAGNGGPATRTIVAPAAARLVMTVGAGIDPHEGGFTMAFFSSRGPTADGRVKPDVWAPGVNIMTVNSEGGYRNFGGTSAASPFVAGVAALMLQANPSLTPAQLKTLLKQTAQTWGAPKLNIESGAGRIQPYQAMVRLTGTPPALAHPPVVPLVYNISLVNGLQTYRNFWLRMSDRNFPLTITGTNRNYPGSSLSLQLYDPSKKMVDFAYQTNHGVITFPLPEGKYPGVRYRLKIKPLYGTWFGHVVISGDCEVKEQVAADPYQLLQRTPAWMQ